MASAVLDTFRESKYILIAGTVAVLYGTLLFFLDQFVFFTPYLTFYIPSDEVPNFVLDLFLTFLTAVVLTVSVRQIQLQRHGGNTKVGFAGIAASLLAGACPCYYLIPLLAIAGTVGSTLGAVGIFLNTLQVPIKAGSVLILLVATYKLDKSGICKINAKLRTTNSQT